MQQGQANIFGFLSLKAEMDFLKIFNLRGVLHKSLFSLMCGWKDAEKKLFPETHMHVWTGALISRAFHEQHFLALTIKLTEPDTVLDKSISIDFYCFISICKSLTTDLCFMVINAVFSFRVQTDVNCCNFMSFWDICRSSDTNNTL